MSYNLTQHYQVILEVKWKTDKGSRIVAHIQSLLSYG